MNPWSPSWAKRLVAALWVSPTAILGVAFALALCLAGAWWRPYLGPGVIVLCSRGPLGRAFLRAGWAAFTVGPVVMSWEPTPNPYTVLHETGHTAQALLLGPLFLPCWVCLALGGYRGNPLEVAARVRAGEPPYGWR